MLIPDDVLVGTEQRFDDRATQRSANQQTIRAVARGEQSPRTLDTPGRLAERMQRLLSEPLVHNARTDQAWSAEPRSLATLGPEDQDLLLERIMGGSNLLGVAFLELGSMVAESVARVHVRDQSRTVAFGTGFMASPRLLMTNHHVLPGVGSARFSRAEFHFENGLDGSPLAVYSFDLQPDLFFLSDKLLDFTLVAVTELSRPGEAEPVELAQFGHNRLSAEQGKAIIGESINIIQHPDGQAKQVALQDNELIDRLDDFLHYHSDTSPGSSGSPLFNNQWEIVGLHHSGVPAKDEAGHVLALDGSVWDDTMGETRVKWVANEGIRTSSILARLAEVAPKLPAPQQVLLDEVLNPQAQQPATAARPSTPGPALPAGTDGSRPVLTDRHEVLAASNGSLVTTVAADASGTVTVPLSITVSVGAPPAATGAAASLVSPSEYEIKSIDPDYDNRICYDPSFLGVAVPLPALSAQQQANVAVNRRPGPSGDPNVLTYQHFSVVMNRARRLAYYTAVNIDASVSRGQERDRDQWFFDPRLDPAEQIGGGLYEGNDFDRGHLVRRLDPAWGENAHVAQVANDDTFHYTNCSPQHKNFNRNASLWAGLENYILADAKAHRMRVTLFNGPHLADDDPTYQDVQIPLAFWKVLVFNTPSNKPTATAYLISQKKLVEGMLKEAFTPETFQVPVQTVTQLTGLDFTHLDQWDPLAGAATEATGAREALAIPTPGHAITTYGDLVL